VRLSNSQFLVLGIIFAVGSLGEALDFSTTSPIVRFRQVSEGRVYRGAAPEVAGVSWLAQNQFKTIIDLRVENPKGMYDEYRAATARGIRYISVPMNPLAMPKDAEINHVENILGDKSLQPIFVHCTFGDDRTGLVIALYRVFIQKMSPQDAYQEMMDSGFHVYFDNLTDYFSKRTGYYPAEFFVLPHNGHKIGLN
jgi:protein tyrosine/serine phosphatase